MSTERSLLRDMSFPRPSNVPSGTIEQQIRFTRIVANLLVYLFFDAHCKGNLADDVLNSDYAMISSRIVRSLGRKYLHSCESEVITG